MVMMVMVVMVVVVMVMVVAVAVVVVVVVLPPRGGALWGGLVLMSGCATLFVGRRVAPPAAGP
eukprot:gene5245-3535_t